MTRDRMEPDNPFDVPEDADIETSINYGDEISYSQRSTETASESFSARYSWVTIDEPVSIMGYDPHRRRALVKNGSADFGLFVGARNDLNLFIGYLLNPGETIEIFTEREVYARAGVTVAGVEPTAPIPCILWIESNR